MAGHNYSETIHIEESTSVSAAPHEHAESVNIEEATSVVGPRPAMIALAPASSVSGASADIAIGGVSARAVPRVAVEVAYGAPTAAAFAWIGERIHAAIPMAVVGEAISCGIRELYRRLDR